MLVYHYGLGKETKQANFCIFYNNILWYTIDIFYGENWDALDRKILQVVAGCIFLLKVYNIRKMLTYSIFWKGFFFVDLYIVEIYKH